MAAAQVQELLRFLSQQAKVPLATALGKVKELQKADLTTADKIAKCELKALQAIFLNDKVAKQVLSAAKKVSKKRPAPTGSTEEGSTEGSAQKRSKGPLQKIDTTPYATECALALPESSATEEELSKIVLQTNRAPLVLAFAVCVLRYTMPEQPISSRLSLAQAVVSANSRSKAVSLGIESGQSAEQEGWGEGQPIVTILGRDIKVLKRWDYDPREGEPSQQSNSQGDSTITAAHSHTLGECIPSAQGSAPPLWGIDIEALRKANRSGAGPKANKPLPIFTADSARSYLLKSFTEVVKTKDNVLHSPQKKGQAQARVDGERCLGNLLRSIDLVCQSWVSSLNKDDLDRRAWAWYVHVRPDVRSGVEGWGEKGLVKLSDILALRRQP